MIVCPLGSIPDLIADKRNTVPAVRPGRSPRPCRYPSLEARTNTGDWTDTGSQERALDHWSRPRSSLHGSPGRPPLPSSPRKVRVFEPFSPKIQSFNEPYTVRIPRNDPTA